MTGYHHTHPSDPAVPRDDQGRLLDRLLDVLLDRDPPVLRAHRFGHEGDGDAEGGDAEDDVLAAFRRQAETVHERVVHDHGVFLVEFLGSTGSGKTRLLERIVERSPDDERIGAVVGDVAGDDDARRLRALDVEVANVNTGKECHLDPNLVEGALADLDLAALDTLYVENVGNMVCPADFPLGAQARVIVVSTTEGDDVVRKHPLLFQACDATVVNKTDLAGAVGADVEAMAADVAEVAPDMPVIRTSAKTEAGIDDLVAYLDDRRAGDHTLADHARDHSHADGAHGHSDHDHGGDDHAHADSVREE